MTFTILSGGNPIGSAVSASVSSGSATATYALPAGTSGGTYTIQAVYNDIADYAGSTDTSQSLTINAAATTSATASASVPFSTVAQNVSLSTTVTSPAGTLNEGTETFTVLLGSTVIGSPVTANVVAGAAVASYGIPGGTAAGTYTIQAVYSGTINFLGYTDKSQVLVIKAPDYWTGASAAHGGSDNWSNPGNWTLGAPPNAGDTAYFTHSESQYSASNVDTSFSIANLTIDSTWGGSIGVSGSLTISGNLILASGTLGGNGAISVAGTGSQISGGTVNAGSGGLTNSGTITWAGGTLNGTFTNVAAGTIDVTSGTGGGRVITGTLVNQGQIVVGTSTYLQIGGNYDAAGGSISGPGYLYNCTLTETAAPASASTIVIAGTGDVLASANLSGYTIWVNGNGLFNSDAVLSLGANVTNAGTILLQSSNNTYQSNLVTGSHTLTNVGTITAEGGSGGNRIFSGTVVNQGTISGGNDYLEIIGAYYADGGSTTNQAELGGCALYETASPSSASTITIAGNGDVLETDNLSGYTIWVNGNGLFNTDATLNLGASVTNENGGTILLQSSNNTYQSNLVTGSHTLTNAGTITAEGGSGGNRIFSGTVVNQGTISGGNDYLEIIGAYYADGGSTTNQAELGGCALYETASPSSASTITIAGNGDVLETDNLSGYTIWVNGNGLFNTDATLNLGASVTNENGGTILLQSSNNTYQSNLVTGSHTLTNAGTITAEGGSGGNRIFSGTVVNQGTISGGNDYLEIIGAYYADGGSTTNQAELGGCALYETASPSSASTITIAGNGDVLETDNLSGYTIWVNGNGLFNTDATLNLGASVTNENGGTILLQSSNNTYQSNLVTGSHTLTNAGTITAAGGSGGNRIFSGTVVNQGTISGGNDYLEIIGAYYADGGSTTNQAELGGCSCSRRRRRRRLRRSRSRGTATSWRRTTSRATRSGSTATACSTPTRPSTWGPASRMRMAGRSCCNRATTPTSRTWSPARTR